jgi:putative oxidoreductase
VVEASPRNLPIAIAKAILGMGFLIFGANGLLHFLPAPAPESSSAQSFLSLLESTGYLKGISILEMLGGGLILGGRLAPLGLLILGPILVNQVLFHALMDPTRLPLVVVLAGLALFVGLRHKEHFAPFFKAHREHCTFKGK